MALLMVLPDGAHAQTAGERRIAPVAAVRLTSTGKIVIDGKLDDAAWQRAAPIKEFFEYRPRDALAAKYATEARIVYDNHSLYIGLTAFDPAPELIDAPLVRRDQVQGSQDFFAVHIDPVGARKFAQIFRVNASGAIGDGLYNEDTGNEDFSPDFEFQVRTSRNAEGWTAEMRIPFSTLRFADPPSANWSILIVRGMGRDNVYRFANARIPRELNCFMCYAQTLSGMTDLPPGRELTVTPQLTLRRTTELQSGRAENRQNNLIVGTDIKYRPRPDLVIDATINPDFSQVELDIPQLAANAQFAFFLPEKRPFFLEGADILDSPMNAIYTRSITDPAWGARLTQRTEQSDFTILTARDDGKGLILLPGPLNTGFATQQTKSQATVGRYRASSGNLSYGALITDRTYEKASGQAAAYNRVVGADFTWRPVSELRVRGQVLASDTKDDANARPAIPARDQAGLADYNYRDAQWRIAGGLEYVGRGFRADNGFFSQAGYTNVYQEIQRKWSDVGPFIELSPYINLARKTGDNSSLLYEQLVPGLFGSLPKGTNLGFEIRSNVKVRFRDSGEALKRDQFYAWMESSPGTWLSRFYVETIIGDRGDIANNKIRRGYYVAANATLRVSNRWEIEPRIEESIMGTTLLPGVDEKVIRERAVQITSVYHFTARDYVRFIGQYAGVKRNLAFFAPGASADEKSQTVSVVYGHLRGLGTSFYLGASSSRSLDPQLAFSRRQNEVFFKASWAFDLAALNL